MLKLFLWLKYVRKRRIILLSVVAVAMSVSLLIAVASLFTGFIAAFERSAVEAIGDIIIRAPDGLRFEKYPTFIERLEHSDVVEAATASLSAEGLLHIGGGDVRPVVIWGIEPQRRERVVGLKENLIRQGKLAGEPSFAVADAPGATGGFVGIGVLAKPDEQTDQYDQEAVCKKMMDKPVSLTTGTMELAADGQRSARRMHHPLSHRGHHVHRRLSVRQQLRVPSYRDAPEGALSATRKRPVATMINVKLRSRAWTRTSPPGRSATLWRDVRDAGVELGTDGD